MQVNTDTANITAAQIYSHMVSVVDAAVIAERNGGDDWTNVYGPIERAVHTLGIEEIPGVHNAFARLAEEAAGSHREGGDDGTRIMTAMSKTQNEIFGLIAIHG